VRTIIYAVTVLLLATACITFNPVSHAEANGYADWSAIGLIYYNPSQEDAYNDFLATAANELKNFLGDVGQILTIETVSMPTDGAIYLEVNASIPELAGKSEEAFHLVADDTGIHITGKTPIAVRHGTYYLLDECLGFRWFFPTDTWTIEPDSLPVTSTIIETVQDPVYFCRQLHFATTVVRDWNRRNRMWGAYQYQAGEIYRSILQYSVNWNNMTGAEKRAFYLHDTDVFFPEDEWLDEGLYPSYPWQLNPYNSTVQLMAENFTNYRLSLTPDYLKVFDTNDYLAYGSLSATPNDGVGWDPPYNADTNPPNDYQAITNAAYTLANVLAENISASYPDKYIAVLGYTHYGGIPEFDIESKIIPIITTRYNYTDLTTIEQLQGLYGKTEKLGIYDYPDFIGWNKDKPVRNWNSIRILDYLYDRFGIDVYNSEAYGTAWGAKGPTYYGISKLLWDPARDFEEILLDFYTKAFGPARGIMQRYYETAGTDTNGTVCPGNVALRFRLLDQAEKTAQGHDDIIARIHELQYYERFLWKFWLTGVYGGTNLAGLDQAGLEDLYTLITKVDSLHILNTEYLNAIIADAIVDRFGSEYPDATTVETKLADYTTPTSVQAGTWLAEALAAFSGYSDADVYFDPFYYPIKIEDAVTTSYPVAEPAATQFNNTYIVPCNAGESVTIAFKGNFQSYDVVWQNPYGLDDTKIPLGNLTEWTNYQFTADVAGNWKLITPIQAGTQYVDIPDHKASKVIYNEGFETIWLSESQNVGCKWYFYVPPGTNSFKIILTCPDGKTVTGTITDSDSSPTIINIDQETEFVFSSPVEGIWSINLPAQNHNAIKMDIKGIQPLVWHDPDNLIISEVISPVGDANGDYTVDVGDLTRLADIILMHEALSPGSDVNNDGVVNVLDMAYVARIILGQY
jgi:hypothetical protein